MLIQEDGSLREATSMHLISHKGSFSVKGGSLPMETRLTIPYEIRDSWTLWEVGSASGLAKEPQIIPDLCPD